MSRSILATTSINSLVERGWERRAYLKTVNRMGGRSFIGEHIHSLLQLEFRTHSVNWVRSWRQTLLVGQSLRPRLFSDPSSTSSVDLLSTSRANGTKDINPVLNARQLYESCINETNIEVDGIEPILQIINTEFGGWPILDGPTWNSSNFNLANLLLKLRHYDDGIFFSVNTATNQANSSIYDIEVKERRFSFRLIRWIV